LKVNGCKIEYLPTPQLKALCKGTDLIDHSKLIDSEESHSVILYGNSIVLKIFRHIHYSSIRDVEISRFLSETIKFPNVPEYYGNIEFFRPKSFPATLGICQEYAGAAGTAKDYLADGYRGYYEKMTSVGPKDRLPKLKGSLSNPASFYDLTLEGQKLLGGAYLEHVLLLGQRTAEMHKALASAQDNKDFKYEEFSLHYQKSLYSGLKTLIRTTSKLLNAKHKKLSDENKKEVKEFFKYTDLLEKSFRKITLQKIDIQKIRIHGHYHLSRILFTGNDFEIIGFEGDLSFSFHQKKVKKSPLRDLATLIYSIHRTAQLTSINNDYNMKYPIRWFHYISGFLVNSYIGNAKGEKFVPTNRNDFNNLLEIFLLERCLTELRYELERKPANIGIPIRLIRYVCDQYVSS
jgi:maltose alpha-D-glucosyltransferase/alpha-amylase